MKGLEYTYKRKEKMEKEVANMRISIVAEIKSIIVPQPALRVFYD